MGFIGWIRRLFGVDDSTAIEARERASLEAVFSSEDGVEVIARTAALQSVTNLIASTLAKCDFRTYQRGKEIRGNESYLWNVRPSANCNSSAFLYKLVESLCFNREALVIEANNQLLAADHWSVDEYALLENVYSGVTVGNFIFDRKFPESEVMRFRLTSKSATDIVMALTRKWDELLGKSSKSFRRALGRRATLGISAEVQNTQNFDAVLQQMTGTDLRKFLTSDDAVLPLYEGFSYNELDKSKTYKGETTRDMAALVEDIYTYTARGFGVPPALLKGEVADTSKATNNFLTFCIDPLAAMIEEEICAKRYTREDYAAGSRLEVDTSSCIHVDTLEQAANADKLIAASVASPNEVRRLLHLPPVSAKWADEYYRSLNYTPADGGGGEKDE